MKLIYSLSVLAGLIAMIYWHPYATIPVAWGTFILLTLIQRKVAQ